MSVPFGECSVLNDGRRVIAPWKKPGIYIGATFFTGPELRLPDGCLDSKGRVWIAASHQQDQRVSVWLETTKIWWVIPASFFGSRVIIRADGSGVRVAFTTTATTWTCVSVSELGVIKTIDAGSIPSGGGANGMRDWDSQGHPRPLDPLDAPLLGHPVRGMVNQGTLITIATALGPLPDQTVVAKGPDS
jgi:hypothetical protein